MQSDIFLWYKSDQSVTTVTSLYLLLVTVGPWFMKKRKPYNLQYIMMFYNLVQVTLCSYMIFYFFKEDVIKIFSTNFCDQLPPTIRWMNDTDTKAWYFISLYYSAKMLDLLDTVFIILKKKDEQLTFLHVYHHITVMTGTWYSAFIKEDHLGIFLAIINTIIHLVMYCYYFLATMGPKIQKYLWWKKYLTLLQLAQFIIMVSFLVYHILFNCTASCVECRIIWTFNISVYFALFLKFYTQSYAKKFNEDLKKNLNNL